MLRECRVDAGKRRDDMLVVALGIFPGPAAAGAGGDELPADRINAKGVLGLGHRGKVGGNEESTDTEE